MTCWRTGRPPQTLIPETQVTCWRTCSSPAPFKPGVLDSTAMPASSSSSAWWVDARADTALHGHCRIRTAMLQPCMGTAGSGQICYSPAWALQDQVHRCYSYSHARLQPWQLQQCISSRVQPCQLQPCIATVMHSYSHVIYSHASHKAWPPGKHSVQSHVSHSQSHMVWYRQLMLQPPPPSLTCTCPQTAPPPPASPAAAHAPPATAPAAAPAAGGAGTRAACPPGPAWGTHPP